MVLLFAGPGFVLCWGFPCYAEPGFLSCWDFPCYAGRARQHSRVAIHCSICVHMSMPILVVVKIKVPFWVP